MKRSDYTLRGWLMSLVVAAGVICLGLIPPFEVFGLRTERIDALSLLRAECHDIDTEIAEMEVIDNEIARAILDSMLMESPAPENKSKDEELKWSAGKPAELHKPVKLHSNNIEIDHTPARAITVYIILASIVVDPPVIQATRSNANKPTSPQLSAPTIISRSAILFTIFITRSAPL